MQRTAIETQPVTAAPVHVLSDYITEGELAAELGVCGRTLRRWHVFGEGPPRRKIGQRILYRRRAVEAWLADGESAGRGGQKRAA